MAGLLEGMSPNQYGLLAAGLGMMGNSRGRSLGESISAGGIQGINAMNQMQQAQLEAQQQEQLQAMRDMQLQQMQEQMATSRDRNSREARVMEAMKGADISNNDAISKILMENGMYEDAIRLKNGNAMNQFQLALMKAQIPSYGEAERLQIAKNSDARAAQDQVRQNDQFERTQSNQEYANELANWKLLNPNYEKNQAAINEAESTYNKLENSLNAYYDILKNQGQWDRHNPMGNADLQTAYQQATWPLRDDSMMNTGVLQAAEMPMLNKALTDPTSFSAAGFRDYAELEKQKTQLLATAKANLDAKRKSLSPSMPPPIKGMKNLQKLDNPQAEADMLRKSGDTEAASQLEAMAKRQELRKKHGIGQ